MVVMMMAMMKARVVGLALGGWIASVLIALSAHTTPAPPPAQAAPADGLPDGEGKATVVAVCEPCHGVALLRGNFKTRLEWEELLEEMGDFGAKATDDQWTEISAYLLKHFSKIHVNKAAARDFETVLDVDPKLAEAIVSYRTDHGPFATLDDLKKVPGIDATLVDARAKRLTFYAMAGSAFAQSPLPEGPGRDVTVSVCGQCHAPEIVASVRLTRDGWQETIRAMVQQGAKGTDQDLQAVLEYVSQHFKGEADRPLNVNAATSVELESVAGLLRKEAAALIAYREKNGPCKTLEDLKNVPGLDYEKIDARKDRLVCR